MRHVWIILCLSLMMGGWAQEDAAEDDFDRPVVDGVQMGEELFLSTLRAPGKLVAPQIGARKLNLPPTIAPEAPQGVAGTAAPATMPIGYLLDAPRGLFENTPWRATPDGGYVKRLELRSENATALRVVLTDIGGLELRVYDPAAGYAFGPYTHPRLNEDGTWWSTVIFGDMIGLELYAPPGATPPRKMPEIVGIFYMYADFENWFSDFNPASGDCYTDAVCFPAWIDSIEGRAIGRLMGTTGCTGALINRNPSDFAPIMLTARHCINTQAAANGVIVIWFWQSQTCNGKNPPNLNSLPRNDGALLLKTDFSSEWTLLGLYEPPGSDSYVGWDPNYWSNGGAATGISHPAGLPKRIQFGTKTTDSNCLGAGSFYAQWTTGRVTGGSSGSPVYDANRRVRGTLSCATDTDGDGVGGPCANDGWYGRLDLGFPELRWYISGMANPTFVNRAVSGDPGNDGANERGTSGNPFNTVYEGTFCVPTGGTVRIAPGSYNERFRLWRAMRLEREGSSGVVRIGAP